MAVLAMLLLVAACGGEDGDRRGVGVRSINTNVGLGVEIESAAPPNTVVRSPRRAPTAPRATIPPLEFVTPKTTTRPCPEAGPFDFPAVETGVEPEGRPAEGNYPWKLDGEVSTGFGTFTIDDFDTRVISNVEDIDGIPDAYRFRQTQTNFFDERRNRGSLTTVYRVVPRSPASTEQASSDAGRGLYVESIVFKGRDSEGREVETSFNPVPAVQLLAYPVEDGAGNGGSSPTGAPLSSSGTDPSTGAELTIRGKVSGKKQVDACGDRVDSWFVNAEQIFRYTDDRTGQTETLESNYDYGVAIQFGSMIVFEHVDAPKDGPVVTVDARVARVPKAAGR